MLPQKSYEWANLKKPIINALLSINNINNNAMSGNQVLYCPLSKNLIVNLYLKAKWLKPPKPMKNCVAVYLGGTE